MEVNDFSLGGRFENRGGRHTAASFIYQGKRDENKILNNDFSLGGRFENGGGRHTAASLIYQGQTKKRHNRTMIFR